MIDTKDSSTAYVAMNKMIIWRFWGAGTGEWQFDYSHGTDTSSSSH